MTKRDRDEVADEQPDGAIIVRRAVIGIGGTILLVLIAGMIAGYLATVLEDGAADLADAGIVGAMVLAAGGIAYAMRRQWPEGDDEPVAPRVRNARRILIASLVLGVPLGFMLGMADDGARVVLSNAPISPLLAAGFIAAWLIPGPLLTWLWWRQIDEHEAGAYREGAVVAIHAYVFLTPAWWIATRAGWLPPQEPMLVLLAVSLVWGLVWFVRRYF